MIPFPNKKYQIIYADPPWKYNARIRHSVSLSNGVSDHYKSMSFDDIKKLSIPDLAENNCALFLWCTFPYLEKQIQLFKYWGFRRR